MNNSTVISEDSEERTTHNYFEDKEQEAGRSKRTVQHTVNTKH